MPRRGPDAARACARSSPAPATARRLLAMLRRGQDVRRAKIRRLRSAIRSGAYENSLKLEVAMERLLGEVR